MNFLQVDFQADDKQQQNQPDFGYDAYSRLIGYKAEPHLPPKRYAWEDEEAETRVADVRRP